jgi:KDO2-lipid IV(A) lauroyltransferase
MDRMSLAARALHALLRGIGRLPWRALQALGVAVGGLLRLARQGPYRIARRNLEIAFPALPPAARRTLLRQTLDHAGRAMAETGRFWTRPAADNLPLVRKVSGAALLEAAQAGPAGVIVAAPHLGHWELLNQWLAARAPIAIVYRPPRQAWLEGLLLRARGHAGVTQVRAEAAGVRQLFRVLKGGGTVGILPDQQPKQGDGVFAPFFGLPAFTMTLVPRLAAKTGATVLFAWAERLAGGDGFHIHIDAAPPGIDSDDPDIAAAALNAGVEACVRQAPAQYQWTYKRWSMRPAGTPRRYANRHGPAGAASVTEDTPPHA